MGFCTGYFEMAPCVPVTCAKWRVTLAHNSQTERMWRTCNSNPRITPKGVRSPLALKRLANRTGACIRNIAMQSHPISFYRFRRTATGPTVQLQWDKPLKLWFLSNFWNIGFKRGLWPNPCNVPKLVLKRYRCAGTLITHLITKWVPNDLNTGMKGFHLSAGCIGPNLVQLQAIALYREWRT